MEEKLKQNLQHPVTRPWLENMSTGELIKLADTYGIDIPLGLERIFIIEEILECANAEDQTIKEDITVNPSYSEAVLLPKQYNISYLEVIIRDPLWAFVFWEIKGHDRDVHENAVDFNGYYLHIIPLDASGQQTQVKENTFSIPVGVFDCARYLGFAEHSTMNSGRYVIKLSVIRGDSELLIASSLPFDLPKRYENYDITHMSGNPLIRLSGVQDLIITKNIDRQSRIKRP
jgi:hypothetical protein